MNKIDKFKSWARLKRIYSTTDIKRWGLDNNFTSVDVRAREELIRKKFHRNISDTEAKEIGLVKEGNKNIRWYEVLEYVPTVFVGNQMVLAGAE